MSAAPVIVDIRNISKSYRRGSQVIPVLEDISLTIAAAEFLALMGPSGSGKSTLLNLIAGLDRADSGTIRVGGVDISALPESQLAAWRAAHVGFIFQFYNLIPVLTAFENVELPLILTDLSRRERREHVQRISAWSASPGSHGPLPAAALGRPAAAGGHRARPGDRPHHRRGRRAHGRPRRVAAEDMLVLMERLSREFGKTIIMVTHDPRAARRAATVKHLDKGVLANALEAAVPECL